MAGIALETRTKPRYVETLFKLLLPLGQIFSQYGFDFKTEKLEGSERDGLRISLLNRLKETCLKYSDHQAFLRVKEAEAVLIEENGEPTLVKNPEYKVVPEPEWLTPQEYAQKLNG